MTDQRKPDLTWRSCSRIAMQRALAGALASLALSACDFAEETSAAPKAPDFYKEVSITYEVEGETRTMSRAVGCTHHLTGAGGMLGASNTAFGAPLPSGAAVLFFLPRHPCYPDWRVPFNPPLSSDPEQRWRELYPTVLWLDDADDPELIEFSPFFATVEAGNARVIVREVGLQDVERDAPDDPAPGVDWLRSEPLEKTPIGHSRYPAPRLEYDVVTIIPQDVWSELDSADEISAMPAGAPFSGELAATLPFELNIWRLRTIAGLRMIPVASPKAQPQVDLRVVDWLQPFHYEAESLILEAGHGAANLVFYAWRPGAMPTVAVVRYGGAAYPLGAPALQTGEEPRRFAGFRTASGEIVLIERALISEEFTRERVYGER